MKTPASLATLVDYGIIQDVVRPLMSGKEAQVYLVIVGGEECVAKVYKEASERTFKHRAQYTEGRRTRNSRDQRAVSKRTRHGRLQDEAAWRNAEADMIYRLRDAGVRVPEPLDFVDGVLVMELVVDAHGNPAPRLGDLSFGPSEAYEIYRGLLQETVRMLCAGVVHGDLSDFNVLMGAAGPVLIDFPQSVDPAHNPNARKLLLRDVDNLHRFVERFSPSYVRQHYAQEMWNLYQANRLEPDTPLRGDYRAPQGRANTEEVLALIDDADSEERARRDARGEEAPVRAIERVAPRPLRAVVDFTKQTVDSSKTDSSKTAGSRRRRRARRAGTGGKSGEAKTGANRPASSAKHPARTARPARADKPETGASGGGGSATAGKGDRPARRRRRRPRAAGSRKTT